MRHQCNMKQFLINPLLPWSLRTKRSKETSLRRKMASVHSVAINRSGLHVLVFSPTSKCGYMFRDCVHWWEMDTILRITGANFGCVISLQDNRFNHDIDARTGYKTQTLLCMPIKDFNGDVIGVAQVSMMKKCCVDPCWRNGWWITIFDALLWW